MKKELALLSKFATSKHVPITEYVYLKDGVLTSTDLSTFCQVNVDIKGEGLIPLAQLKKIVSKNTIDTIVADDNRVSIHCGKNVFKYDSMPVDDFPSIPERGGFVCNLSVDKEFIAMKTFLCNDGLRESLSGLYFSDNGNVVATDAHKMKWLNKGVKGDFIAPKDIFNVPEGDYEIYKSKHWICLKSENFTFYLRLIDAKFPNYEVVIPEDSPESLRISKKELQKHIDNALLCAEPTKNVGFIDMGNKRLESMDVDSNTEYNGVIDASSNSELRIGFNLKLMSDVIKSFTEQDDVIIEASEPSRAMIINKNSLLIPCMSY